MVVLGILQINEICKTAKLFHDRGRYHIETSPLICSANQWTGFYMIETTVMNDLNCDNYFCKRASL